jgi:Ca-activated chloride channel family protein
MLAHQLFVQGDYVRSAEIFTDPAWKGIALYRSAQWWRAAEAFVRAGDPRSAFNLGNCYVKLGYYELALDAYQQALAMDPALTDAQHNADIMRKLLADDDDESQRSGRQPSGDALEQLDTQADDRQGGRGAGGEEPGKSGEPGTSEQSEQGEHSLARQDEANSGQGGEASEQQQLPAGSDGSGAVNGAASEQEPASQPSGSSEADAPTDDSQAAGLRTALETDQATTQWLNQIHHDATLFLQRRIALELRRRQASGQAAPDGGSTW